MKAEVNQNKSVGKLTSKVLLVLHYPVQRHNVVLYAYKLIHMEYQ